MLGGIKACSETESTEDLDLKKGQRGKTGEETLLDGTAVRSPFK